MGLEGKRSIKNDTERRAERTPLYAPQSHEYGAKAAYIVEEITGERPWWSSLLFNWISPLLELGKSRHLTAVDLFPLNDAHDSTRLTTQLEAQWTQERSQNGRRASLLRALLASFGDRVFLVGGLKIIGDSFAILAAPVLIRAIIDYVRNTSASAIEGLFYTVVVLVVGVVQTLVQRHYEYLGAELGICIRSAVTTVVYKHMLSVAPSILQRAAPGQVAGYVTADAVSLEDGLLMIYDVGGALLQVILGGLLLWSCVGNAMWAGVILLVLSVPCSLYLDARVRHSKLPLMEAKEERVQLLQELLAGVKALKLLTWERSFAGRVAEARDTELRQHHSHLLLSGAKAVVALVVPTAVCIVTLMAYVHIVGGELDVARALTALILIMLLVPGPLTSLPRLVVSLRDVRASLLRVNSFLTEPTRLTRMDAIGAPSVAVKNADFKWDTYQAKSELDLMLEAQGIFQTTATGPALHHINFYAEAGEIHAVVGSAESGKSTMLAGVAGLVRCCAGGMMIRGCVVYISKEPFLLNANVRDNICFGRPFEAVRYFEAIRLSCLRYDLRSLPQGDRTLVGGERGFTLTLNQRIRIELARSLYRNPDIYVVDDVLSSMDTHIAKKIFKRLAKKAREASKILLITTASLGFIKQCTSIVVLARGSIIEAGSFKSLVANKKWGVLSEFVRADGKAIMEEADIIAAANAGDDEVDVDSDDEEDIRRLALADFAPNVAEDSAKPDDEEIGEENIRGAVALWMMRAIGGGTYLVFILLAVVFLLSSLFTYFGLVSISQATGVPDSLLDGYIAFNVLYLVSSATSTAMINYGSVRAARDIFQILAERLARAPMAFFDSTQSSRLGHRLAKELAVIDDAIANTWPRLFSSSTHLLVTMGVLIAESPWLIFAFAPVILALFRIEECIGSSARALKRIHSSTAAPIQSIVDESLQGVTAIRLLSAEHLFLSQFHDRMNKQHQASILHRSVGCWLGIRVDGLVVALVTCATLAAVHVHEVSEPAATKTAGKVGVALMFVWSVSSTLLLFLRSCDDVRVSLVAGGRVQAYSKMPMEASLESPQELRPRPDWPSTAAIQFENVSVRYRQGLPRVLRGVNLSIKGGDLVTIIGGASSGKKTLFAALSRIVELTTGSITIDCVDISKVGLHDLRSKLSVISATDAVLFSGSIRSNLDPLHQVSDDQIWATIKKVKLDGVVLALDEGVQSRGVNYSGNERQQLCLARAILRKPKVLLVDDHDPNGDVDHELLDRCVRDEFPGCTRMVITDRLSVASESPRVLVMESGQVAEFGSPKELQKNNRSKFRALADDWKRRDKLAVKR